MNTAERASLIGVVIAFVVVVSGAILEVPIPCTQGNCVSQPILSAVGAALVIFGTVLLVISAFFLARERMGRPRTPSPSGARPPDTRSTANRFCLSCGAPIPPDSGFCPKCGKAVAYNLVRWTDSVTIYGYQIRYQSRNAESSCFSRRKPHVWETLERCKVRAEPMTD